MRAGLDATRETLSDNETLSLVRDSLVAFEEGLLGRSSKRISFLVPGNEVEEVRSTGRDKCPIPTPRRQLESPITPSQHHAFVFHETLSRSPGGDREVPCMHAG